MSAADLRALLARAFAQSDVVLGLVGDDAFALRPIHLRHPLVFYLGHLPAFAWNQLARGALRLAPLDAALDELFDRGIDPESDADADAAQRHGYPAPDLVRDYRDAARRALLALPDADLESNADAVHLVVEHELMHHETLTYLLQECPDGALARPPGRWTPGEGRAAERVAVRGGEVTLGAETGSIAFGWDNEFPTQRCAVGDFALDDVPVRNADWMSFLRETGRVDDPAWWPQPWAPGPDGGVIRTLHGPVPFEEAAGWPVQVRNERARDYAAHRGGRLPTEPELHRAAFTTPHGDTRRYPWGAGDPDPSRCTSGFCAWAPKPVGETPAGASAWGVEELVGNGWEHTATPFLPRPGFRAIHRSYPGYSADFFDGAHDVVFGASWATDAKLIRPSFRNWYRRNYPFAFTSFRVAYDRRR